MKVTVYGAEWCPWCRKVKDFLNKNHRKKGHAQKSKHGDGERTPPRLTYHIAKNKKEWQLAHKNEENREKNDFKGYDFHK